MSYDQYRIDRIRDFYDYQIETLMSGFDPTRSTVILLPGGMGSQLHRSEYPYDKQPNVLSNVVWVDPGILTGDARRLEVDANDQDIGKYVVGAGGPLSFIGMTPYGELAQFAQQNNWNYGVFGYDWRRTIGESARFFKYFILRFRRRVIDAYGKKHDPIPKLTVVCHSMGGLVCTHALRDNNFSGLGFHAILTIATPFYGTSTHQDRYFIGIPSFLNPIYTAKTVVRIVASLPGPYSLMFLPKAIYTRDGSKIGLKHYPQYDPNGKADADPYDPAMLKRWPQAVRNRMPYIAKARAEMIAVSDPINTNIVQRFFNVRSTLDKTTAVELLWNDIDGTTINPAKGPSPLAGVAGPGDGTVPGWSAFHAYAKHTHDLTIAKDHGNLLEHDEVLALVKRVVTTGTLGGPKKKDASGPTVATAKTVAKVVAAWSHTKAKQAPPAELFKAPVKRGVASVLIGGEKPRMTRKRPRR